MPRTTRSTSARPAKKATPTKNATPAKKATAAKKVAKKPPVKASARDTKRTAGKSPRPRKATPKKAAVTKTTPKKAAPAKKAAVKKTTTPPARAKKKPAGKTTATRQAAAGSLRRKPATKHARPARQNTTQEPPKPATTATVGVRTGSRLNPQVKKPHALSRERQIDYYKVLFDGDERLTKLWLAYKFDESMDARDELVQEYANYVRFIVTKRLNLTLPPSYDLDDMIGYGIIGLLDAINKFDLDRGLRFETYSMRRVHGAVIDEIRSMDWVSRTVRSRIRVVEEARIAIEKDLTRSATVEEIADATELTVKEVRDAQAAFYQTYVTTLDEPAGASTQNGTTNGDGYSSGTRAERIIDETDQPGLDLEDEETQHEMAVLIRKLPKKERAIIVLYYFERLTAPEVARILGLTVSHVMQLHTQALNRLRANAAGLRPEHTTTTAPQTTEPVTTTPAPAPARPADTFTGEYLQEALIAA